MQAFLEGILHCWPERAYSNSSAGGGGGASFAPRVAHATSLVSCLPIRKRSGGLLHPRERWYLRTPEIGECILITASDATHERGRQLAEENLVATSSRATKFQPNHCMAPCGPHTALFRWCFKGNPAFWGCLPWQGPASCKRFTFRCEYDPPPWCYPHGTTDWRQNPTAQKGETNSALGLPN